jgi:hypothetical protein
METTGTVHDAQAVDKANDEDSDTLNPRIAEALRSIEAEKKGIEPHLWSDFSSHQQH